MMIKKWVGFLGKKNTETKQAYHELMAAYAAKCEENRRLVMKKEYAEENYRVLEHHSYYLHCFDSWEELLPMIKKRWLILWIEHLSEERSVWWYPLDDCRYAAIFLFLQGNQEVLTPEETTLVIEKTGYAQEKISPDARMYRYQESWDAVEDDD